MWSPTSTWAEAAWSNAGTLWFLQQQNATDTAALLSALDHLAGFAGRGLLVPLLNPGG
jgi:hypothetical protein